MVNLNSKGCKQPGCRLTPNFGPRGAGAAPVSCAKHKDAGMVNLVSKRCESDACDRIPSYNWDAPGARAVFCNTHKAEGGRDGRNRPLTELFATPCGARQDCSPVVWLVVFGRARHVGTKFVLLPCQADFPRHVGTGRPKNEVFDAPGSVLLSSRFDVCGLPSKFMYVAARAGRKTFLRPKGQAELVLRS